MLIDAKEQITKNTPAAGPDIVIRGLAYKLEDEYEKLNFYQMLSEITGDAITESSRYIYTEKTVRTVLERQKLSNIYDILFESPQVKRPGYCRLRTMKSIKNYITEKQQAATTAENSSSELEIIKHNLSQIQKIFKDIHNRQVNTQKLQQSKEVADTEKKLINYLASILTPGFHQALDWEKTGTENTVNKLQQVFLHALVHYYRLLQDARNQTYIAIDSPKNKMIIPNNSIYYEPTNILSLPQLFSDYGSALYLQDTVEIDGRVMKIIDIFFEKLNPRECVVRLKVPENQNKFYKEYFRSKRAELPDEILKKTNDTLKEFQELLCGFRNALKQEVFAKLKRSERNKIKTAINYIALKHCLNTEWNLSLQRGLDHIILEDFLYNTNFGDKTKLPTIRNEIEDTYLYYYSYKDLDGSQYRLPLPKEDILLGFTNGPLPKNIQSFLQIKYGDLSDMKIPQETALQQLIALYFAFTNPDAFEKHKAEFIAQEKAQATEDVR